MPTFKTNTWNNITIQLLPERYDYWRSFFSFIPYYWGNDISLDFSIRFPIKKGFHLINNADIPNDKWSYHWEICNHNKKIVLQGDNALNFVPLKHNQLNGRKYNAINIGEDNDLNEGKYKVYIKLRDGKNDNSKRMYYGSFSVRNKEDYLSSNITGFIAIGISIIALIVNK